ncbi:hypothetical protein GYMLUDRAFT_89192 [Collybiopsis luxurians FD-317 M1]|uniref:Unplaced genomic scaffold GYMLUscaffold_132, whole genome shotgun sequence n=1 Tax=Collybiopsis luxurians FD-317 M1 TaxID=944289 RepID=A0A0D0BN30_9AGAR|nr:hypothetical protein GYMLUDRAFT_89192 [Collybiopsis luxurians FD-317 M1]
MSSSILVAFLGALQASASVLLTISYGGLAAYFDLISTRSTVDVSRLAVKLFLPCLLFVNIGSGLNSETIGNYAPIIVWSLAYNIVSIVVASTFTRAFKLPRFVTSAVTFNNATSLPLLLLQSFSESGALSSISGGDTKEAVDRAKSYFLINATISNVLMFSLGPGLLMPQKDNSGEGAGVGETDVEDSGREPSPNDINVEGLEDQGGERIPLLSKKNDRKVASWKRSTQDFLLQFWNPAFVGACIVASKSVLFIGVIVGLVPALHRHFFDENGIFLAWLTISLKNVGNLFASLQVIVVGVKLYSTFVKLRQGQGSASIPLTPTVCILFTRFIIMPVISIPTIYALAAKTRLLDDDPILWFCMMMMPVGPTAMRLTSLADVSKADENEKMIVAKFLALSYIVTPMICFAAVGSLKACEAARA